MLRGEAGGVLLMGVTEVVAVGGADAARTRGRLGLRVVEGGAQRDRGAARGTAREAVQLEPGEGITEVGAERDRELGVTGGVVAADAVLLVVVEVDLREGEEGGAALDGIGLAAQRRGAGDPPVMTRVREETLRHGTAEGVTRGLAVTGGVITSAGLVLAATFAALGVIPILFLAQIAFIVALGVLLDTFVVRTLLVPALVLDVGRSVWWPSRLWRRGAD